MFAPLFVRVGYDASDEVGLCAMQRSHQRVQLLRVEGRHCLRTTSLLLLALQKDKNRIEIVEEIE